ncbi:mycofactocin biosynthesis peptidyl-dipeptidase MftE [Streptomyces sp. NBC_01754]|uniref:mycofactocin biosynthesis peptidyl-dipeptidase MftE n=1 Tax=Streptomyces sp. NBC_01754 TaxID=2975930 RepID=UPI002DD89747|nr:mycofactocin biosynthesis peptidyl-dipeptidase MftE [Streptomyces sp. NBC_01754]WSC94346.1 mycofactocin biosynthesis peptidyl-dipeptidase MftE [Streptomyces sp. NBC_01754]
MSTALARTTWPTVPTEDDVLVLVPVGSTEQHGHHLPLGTDSVMAEAVASRAAARLPGRVVVAPTLVYGNSGEHAGFPGTVSIGHEALRFVLVEMVRSLALWASRTVFVNGHGGNVRALDEAVGQLREEGHDVAWTGCLFPGGDAHAGRSETSAMLHLTPGDVDQDAATAGDTRPIAELLPRLVAGGVRSVAPNGVLGDPTGASAQEGRTLVDDLVTATVHRILTAAPDRRGRLTDPAPAAGR